LIKRNLFVVSEVVSASDKSQIALLPLMLTQIETKILCPNLYAGLVALAWVKIVVKSNAFGLVNRRLKLYTWTEGCCFSKKQCLLFMLQAMYNCTFIFAAMKILMVCLGNICRSPLAEGILQHKADKLGLNWQVDSAGTAGYHVGEPPHKLSIKVAKHNGIDISQQQCRQFVKEDMLRYDKIYVMDGSNYNDVRTTSAELWDESKVDLLLNELYPHQNKNVPDPWYGEEDGYHKVFEMIDKACEEIVKKYSKETNY
jgi:protein-tyrosine phosphatase